MADKTLFFLRKHIFILLMLAWIFLYFSPWTAWLESAPWVRMGISIVIFSTPGIITSLILAGKRLSLLGHFTSGLAFSIFFVGLLGLFGRILHLPFSYIKPMFALVGLLAFFVIIRHYRLESQLYKPKRYGITTLVVFLVLAVLSVIIAVDSRFGGDDFSYLSSLTNWQHAQPLNFQEVIFGSGDLDSVRFWFAMFPMNLAFLAEISNLHGLLLLGLYLEPFFVVISLVAFYNLFEDLLPSGYLPITALLLHFTFLFMLYGSRQPGSTFFYRMSEDKAFAAFILVPIFFLAIRYLLENITFRSAFFTFLTGLSLAFTHPIILAYGIAIAGFYAFFLTLIDKNYKKLALVIILLIAIISPVASLRFVGVPWVSRYIFGLQSTLRQPGAFNLETASEKVDAKTIISGIKGTRFYGFNLERVQLQIPGRKDNSWQDFFSWSYVWILGLSFLWSLFNIKKNNTAAFVGATSLLVLLCAIPYTGWLWGSLVSARMLWRAPWMFSAGIAGVILVHELLGFISRWCESHLKRQFPARSITVGLISLICLVLICSFSITFYFNQWQRLPTLDNQRSKLQEFVDLGKYLENNIKTVSVFLAPREFSDYLPGISSKSKVVFFRTAAFTRGKVNLEKINLVFSPNTSISIDQRIDTLMLYQVDYILVKDRLLKNYYASYPEFFRVQEYNDFWILEFRKTEP